MHFPSSVLRRNKVEHVAIVEGGFFAIHEFLVASNHLDWLVDHDTWNCQVCAATSLQRMVTRVKDTVSQTAQSVAMRAFNTLHKVQDSVTFAKSGEDGENRLKDVQATVTQLGEKGRNLVSKAFWWTRQQGTAIAEEVNKRGRRWGSW